MSPRAAWRLEQLGFDAVFDYTAGKVDWLAAGLATEGTSVPTDRVVAAMATDVPTCGLDEPAGAAARRARAAGWEMCVVVNDRRVVAGRIVVAEVADDDGRAAVEAMRPGPATIRAHDDRDATLRRMADRHVATLLVTTPGGELLGALRAPG